MYVIWYESPAGFLFGGIPINFFVFHQIFANKKMKIYGTNIGDQST